MRVSARQAGGHVVRPNDWHAKAEAALAAKRVVGGRKTMTFNLLPLKYGWA
jgi:hypothetical protein